MSEQSLKDGCVSGGLPVKAVSLPTRLLWLLMEYLFLLFIVVEEDVYALNSV